mmetsp:Transcript_145783/g.254529  ORF Transcript_145783/g.254529 Transcript_145783/m.254529 type:complete len:94 (-) Transcript_145783:33-314(-)
MDKFLHDVLPGVDDCHQIERSAVHAMQGEEFVGIALALLGAMVKVFRKKELVDMELAAKDKDWIVGGWAGPSNPSPPPWGILVFWVGGRPRSG